MESARSEIPTKPALLNSPLSSPQVLLALNHELSMCSRPSSLVFPRSQVTHFSSTARLDGSLSAFWRSHLMTLSTVYAIAL